MPTPMDQPTEPTEPTDPNQSQADIFHEARKLIDENADAYVDRLAEAVAIQSVSTDLTKRDQCFKMADLLHRWMQELGGTCDKVLVGFQELESGERYDLPPVLLAEFSSGNKASKPTVLVYGHYDVQPAVRSEGWNTDPFELTEVDGALYGRGSTDDKGPVLCWLWAIDTYRQLEIEMPVNVKICVEGMEESNSECLEGLLTRETREGGFLCDIDYVVISDNYWVTTSKPCLTYGLRGIATFQCEVKGGSIALHSGVFGGVLTEPMTDVVQLLAAVSAAGHGDIGIEGCGKNSALPLTDEEKELYGGISFDTEAFKKEAGNVSTLVGKDRTEVLMNRWRYPSLSIHGIEGGFSDSGFKTVIPGSATGKFSMRLVPGQDVKGVEEAVTKTLKTRFEEMKSGNELRITSTSDAPWLADPKCGLYQAGAAALLKVYGVRPDLTREGGSIPITGVLQDALGVETMLLPLGASDDGAHSQNEKFGRKNYIYGIQVLFTLLYEIERVDGQREKGGKGKKKGTFGRLKDIWYGLS